MTAKQLHELVDAMVRDSEGRVVPTHLEVSEDVNPFELYDFLATNQHVRRVETPVHWASVRDGVVFVVAHGSLSYSDGL